MTLPFDLDFQPIISYLNIHPHVAVIVAFFVVFLEAMAVIGVIVPGSITMTAIGVLIGSNVIPAGPVLSWAVVGAILGDLCSYWAGVYFQDRIHRFWPFKKHPELLVKSEKFFAKHGVSSVFLGRFIGPMRAMVPMVAGMLKMRFSKFLIAAIPSAGIWAILYMLPGIILGALSLELPPKVATQFILVALGFIVGIWTITWLIQHFAKRAYRWLDRYVMRLWLFLQSHNSLHWITEGLSDPREPENHQQLSLLFVAFILFTTFIGVLINIIQGGSLTIFNNAVYNLLLSLRIHGLDNFFVATTLLAESKVLLIAGLFLLAWLMYKRYWYVAIHWFVILALSGGAIFEVKNIFFSPRPGGTLNYLHDSSFPSGHTAFSLSLMGFWAVIVARELKPSRRWIPYFSIAIVVFSILLSRLYLGAHWLTDVFGGFLLGLFLVLIMAISYRRRHLYKNEFSLSGFMFISICSLLLTWTTYSAFKYHKEVKNYQPHWNNIEISKANWSYEVGKSIPLYRLNRLGIPTQAFNIQWLGNLDEITKVLEKHGWEQYQTSLDLKDLALRFIGDKSVNHLSLFPQLYRNQHMSLLMIRETDQENKALILRLWQSGITIKDSKLPLWLGVVEYHYAEPKLLHSFTNGKKHIKFMEAVEELNGETDKFTWQKVVISPEQQPKEMLPLHWNGKVFLIKQY